MKATIRKWLGITAMMQVINDLVIENGELKKQLRDTRQHVSNISGNIDSKMAKLDSLATMDLDGGYRGPNTIVLTGVFRGRGYVKFVDVEHDEFRHMVEMYRGRKSLFRNEDRIMYQGGSFSL